MEDQEKKDAAVSTAQAQDQSPAAVVSDKYTDITLHFLEEHEHLVEPLTSQKKSRLSRKLYINVLLLLIFTNLMLFIDKSTLSASTLLGVFDSTHINETQYNNLNTLFYVGYIVAQAPGSYLMQRLPLGKYVAGTVFLWAVLVFLHCTASNYGGLIVLRLLLGAVEASLVPAMEITLAMFFVPDERALVQPLFWTSCSASPIPTGFISYGLLYTKSSVPPWKLFMILTGGVTILLAIYNWVFYPDNPIQARFLNTEEKVYVIQCMHEATRSSIEQKVFKPRQFWEAVRDPISWLFGLVSFFLMLSNNLQMQQNLIFEDIGVSNLGSTLVSAASGGFSVAACVVATILMKLFPNNTGAYWSAFWCVPAFAGGIAVVAVPWSKKIALLACLIIASGTYAVTYVTALGWATSSTAGHTKKLVRNVLFMAGYGIANIIAPQIWVAHDAPRYYPAWIVQIVVSWVGTPVILLTIRWILSRRNRERLRWIEEQTAQGKNGIGYVQEKDENNDIKVEEVNISMLDLTDLENRYFIYPL